LSSNSTNKGKEETFRFFSAGPPSAREGKGDWRFGAAAEADALICRRGIM
jgi:hypothetical protein